MNQTAATFPLGTIVATASILDSVPVLDILIALDRHAAGDWRNLTDEDRAVDELALALGERSLSAYAVPGGKSFWIITERDRSVTTVLLPQDYRSGWAEVGPPLLGRERPDSPQNILRRSRGRRLLPSRVDEAPEPRENVLV